MMRFTETGTRENSVDILLDVSSSVNGKNKDGIRSRLFWKPGIGYARTHGNSKYRILVF